MGIPRKCSLHLHIAIAYRHGRPAHKFLPIHREADSMSLYLRAARNPQRIALAHRIPSPQHLAIALHLHAAGPPLGYYQSVLPFLRKNRFDIHRPSHLIALERISHRHAIHLQRNESRLSHRRCRYGKRIAFFQRLNPSVHPFTMTHHADFTLSPAFHRGVQT